MNLNKKLFLRLLITLTFGISFTYSMEEYYLEAQLVPYNSERHEKEDTIGFYSQLKSQLSSILFYSSSDKNINDTTDLSLELLAELPPELSAYILSFLPEDISVNCFIRHIPCIHGSPYETVADSIKKKYHNYILKKCETIMKLREFQKFSRRGSHKKEKIAKSVLSFMATTKNNDYFWTPSYLLNYIIPEYNPKKTLDLDYDMAHEAIKRYVKDVRNVFRLLKNSEIVENEENFDKKTSLAYKCLKLHMVILQVLSNRLIHYPYFNMKQISYSCNNKKCIVGPVNWQDADNNCYIRSGITGGGVSGALLFLLCMANAPWYYLATTGILSAVSFTAPCCIHQYIACENKKYEPINKEITNIMNLLLHAHSRLNTSKNH